MSWYRPVIQFPNARTRDGHRAHGAPLLRMSFIFCALVMVTGKVWVARQHQDQCRNVTFIIYLAHLNSHRYRERRNATSHDTCFVRSLDYKREVKILSPPADWYSHITPKSEPFESFKWTRNVELLNSPYDRRVR